VKYNKTWALAEFKKNINHPYRFSANWAKAIWKLFLTEIWLKPLEFLTFSTSSS
jgi:hypothetical protein